MISLITDFLFVVVAAKLKLGICVAHLHSVSCQSSLCSRTNHLFAAFVASVNEFSVLLMAGEDKVGKSLAWG